jgi:hypothetical protein
MPLIGARRKFVKRHDRHPQPFRLGAARRRRLPRGQSRHASHRAEDASDIVATPTQCPVRVGPLSCTQRTGELARRTEPMPSFPGYQFHSTATTSAPCWIAPPPTVNAGPYLLLSPPPPHWRRTESICRGCRPASCHRGSSEAIRPHAETSSASNPGTRMPHPGHAHLPADSAAPSLRRPPPAGPRPRPSSLRCPTSVPSSGSLRRLPGSAHALARRPRGSCSPTIHAASSRDVLCPGAELDRPPKRRWWQFDWGLR